MSDPNLKHVPSHAARRSAPVTQIRVKYILRRVKDNVAALLRELCFARCHARIDALSNWFEDLVHAHCCTEGPQLLRSSKARQ